MGAHSTLRITRTAAREYLMRELMRADDNALEDMMGVALYDRLYNACIVSDDEENEDERL